MKRSKLLPFKIPQLALSENKAELCFAPSKKLSVFAVSSRLSENESFNSIIVIIMIIHSMAKSGIL